MVSSFFWITFNLDAKLGSLLIMLLISGTIEQYCRLARASDGNLWYGTWKWELLYSMLPFFRYLLLIVTDLVPYVVLTSSIERLPPSSIIGLWRSAVDFKSEESMEKSRFPRFLSFVRAPSNDHWDFEIFFLDFLFGVLLICSKLDGTVWGESLFFLGFFDDGTHPRSALSFFLSRSEWVIYCFSDVAVVVFLLWLNPTGSDFEFIFWCKSVVMSKTILKKLVL